jgi:hypothetical protein
MKIKKAPGRTLSNIFNVLSFEKGGWAAYSGYCAIAAAIGAVMAGGALIAGTGGIALPVVTGLITVANVGFSRSSAKAHDKKTHDKKKGLIL